MPMPTSGKLHSTKITQKLTFLHGYNDRQIPCKLLHKLAAKILSSLFCCWSMPGNAAATRRNNC